MRVEITRITGKQETESVG